MSATESSFVLEGYTLPRLVSREGRVSTSTLALEILAKEGPNECGRIKTLAAPIREIGYPRGISMGELLDSRLLSLLSVSLRGSLHQNCNLGLISEGAARELSFHSSILDSNPVIWVGMSSVRSSVDSKPRILGVKRSKRSKGGRRVITTRHAEHNRRVHPNSWFIFEIIAFD